MKSDNTADWWRTLSERGWPLPTHTISSASLQLQEFSLEESGALVKLSAHSNPWRGGLSWTGRKNRTMSPRGDRMQSLVWLHIHKDCRPGVCYNCLCKHWALCTWGISGCLLRWSWGQLLREHGSCPSEDLPPVTFWLLLPMCKGKKDKTQQNKAFPTTVSDKSLSN